MNLRADEHSLVLLSIDHKRWNTHGLTAETHVATLMMIDDSTIPYPIPTRRSVRVHSDDSDSNIVLRWASKTLVPTLFRSSSIES